MDVHYKSYFNSEVEVEDQSGESNTKKRKKNDKNGKDLGAPNNEDWENARYILYYSN